jgi:hypothetical protein
MANDRDPRNNRSMEDVEPMDRNDEDPIGRAAEDEEDAEEFDAIDEDEDEDGDGNDDLGGAGA